MWTPPLSLSYFLALHAAGLGMPPAEAWDASTDGQLWFRMLSVNYMVWPVVHAATYTVIPVRHRVLWVSAASLCWSVFLACLTVETHPVTPVHPQC